MPYSNTWITNSPLGSAQAKTADDELRKLRLDLEERLEDQIILDVAADPWVVRQALSGNALNKQAMIHHALFIPDANSIAYSRLDDRLVHSSAGAASYYCSPPLAGGITITQVQFLVNRVGGTNIDCSFGSVTFNTTPTTTIHGTVSTTTTGVAIISITGLTVQTNGANIYFLKVTLNNNDRLHGATVIYNSLNSTTTL